MLDILLFVVIAIVIIGTALGMLLSRNAVYSALFLVVNFASVAILYLILGAPFIALAQVTVYAGAIMVLFLFVIMLLGGERITGKPVLPYQRWLAVLVGVAFLVEIGLFILASSLNTAVMQTPSAEFASPQALGMKLFTEYSLPFEITSVILLAALIGAIVMTRGESRSIREELRKLGKKDQEG